MTEYRFPDDYRNDQKTDFITERFHEGLLGIYFVVFFKIHHERIDTRKDQLSKGYVEKHQELYKEDVARPV